MKGEEEKDSRYGLTKVFAFPKLSNTGFARRIFSSTPFTDPAISAKYASTCFVASVFPAPDSPLAEET
jgi:hypothetical protein